MAKCEHDQRFMVDEFIRSKLVCGCVACKLIRMTGECERLQIVVKKLERIVSASEYANLRIKGILESDWQDNDPHKQKKHLVQREQPNFQGAKE